MEDLKNLEGLVIKVLEQSIEARNSDDVLYYHVCKMINPQVLVMNAGTFLRHQKDYILPPYKSVERCRRKIVETHPELIGTEQVEGGRWSYQKMYKEYAKG